jgi:CHAT domain-containing protein
MLLVGVTSAVIVVSAVLAFRVRRVEVSPNRRLAEAVGAHRVVRARLTGGFAYAPCDTVTPNDSLISGLLCERTRPDQWPEARALATLAAAMRESITKDVTRVGGRQSRGAWHVVWGNVDAAIDELRGAAEADPTNPAAQSDLAAALLARAERAQDPLSLLEAYVAADSALTLDSLQVEAHFNRAVALEWLHLHTDAIAAWSTYLNLDGQSRWAEEARERLRLLRESPRDWAEVSPAFRGALEAGADGVVRDIVRQFPRRARQEVRSEMAAWARAYVAEPSRDAGSLRRAVILARALSAVTTDSLWLDVTERVAEATVKSDHRQLGATARGIIAYERGAAYLGRFVLDSASIWLQEAHRTLSAQHSPVVFLVEYDLADVAYQRQTPAGYTEALAGFRRVRATSPSAYRVVRALAARTEGLIEGIRANYEASITAYSAVIRDGEGTGDAGLELRPQASLARHYASLRGEREAWQRLYGALRASRRYAEASRDVQLVFGVATELSMRRFPTAASLFQREVIRLVGANHSARDSLWMITALSREAELLGRGGLTDRAFESLRKARAYVAGIEADSVRALYSADVDLVAGEAWIGVNPDSAIQVLRRVVDRFQNTRYDYQVDRAQLVLARAYATGGATDSAQRALEAALTETERRRSRILSAEDRARFLDQARPVIDSFVMFRLANGDTLGALEFIERMRARVLLEHVRQDSSRTTVTTETVDDVRRTLDVGTSVVCYAVVGSDVVMWLIRRDGVFTYRSSAARLKQLVDRFTTLLAKRAVDGEVQSLAADLHQRLVAPFAGKLDAGSRIVFVPDKWLHFVPFAALFDPASGQFLVERFEIGVAPSVQLYARAAARYERLARSARPAVVAVGNPSFDERTFSLPPLPGAENEARGVATLYDGARVLIGAEATKDAFLDAAVDADVVHFAGHGVVRPEAPLRSHLVLASSDSGRVSGAFYAHDIAATRLPRTRLAILSACHSASGEVSDTEGASSLARALFAAGVPAVIASLWAVDDAKTAEFFADFHRILSRGEDPTTALRRAQLDWIARDKNRWEDASTWAAFALFGATAGKTLGEQRVQ